MPKTRGLIVGTCHFVSNTAARDYYRPYGETAATVARKIADGEIKIGPPATKPGERLGTTDGGCRYTIIEQTA
jgi:hypothetical protein